MKRIIMMALFVTSLVITGCSDIKKKYLPFSGSSGDGAITQPTAKPGTASVATDITQASPACSTNPCVTGSTVTITVVFKEPVDVTGSPILILDNGQQARYIWYRN